MTKKMVMLMGPRQVGKTTLAKGLSELFNYPVVLNYDIAEQQRRIEKMDWLPSTDCLVLDELHKMSSWKNYLKGLADDRPTKRALLVTGSARLDTFRQAGESLAGRYYSYRLFPYTVKELAQGQHESSPSIRKTAVQALDHLMRFGGFPEPMFSGTDAVRLRWENQYFTDMLREDILEFSRVQELRSMRVLVELLRSRTGSPLSINALAQDLALSPTTVRSYIQILEALHIVFLVAPYHRNIARALTKAPKLYFYDWAFIKGDEGAKFENLVALSLLKHLAFLEDTQGTRFGLHYVQTTTGKEVDFVVADGNGHLQGALEAKLSDSKPSYGLRDLLTQHPTLKAVQLVYKLSVPYVHSYEDKRIEIHPGATWLNGLSA